MNITESIVNQFGKSTARKIDFEFFRLLDKHNLSVQDFIDKKYKAVIQQGPYYENPRWTKYSIRRTRGRNAKKDIDFFVIKTFINKI